MTILNIRKARREGSRLVIGLAGISGDGKTFTALQIAYGLANYDASKIGFLDTENRRGSLYADVLKNEAGEVQEFLIGDLYAPFSPTRYIQAIKEFQETGIEVLVIDSVTHEWEGIGGCIEIAESTSARMADWKKAKAEHKRFMNMLLQSDMHVIVCIRAREKTDFSNPKEPRSLGIQPIQEGNFMFEMTASVMMQEQGTRQQILKCPKDLLPWFGRREGYITADDGKALRDWVDGAKQLDPEVERARNVLQSTTEQGRRALAEAWNGTPKELRAKLGGAAFRDQLLASAEAFDQLREEEAAASQRPNEPGASPTSADRSATNGALSAAIAAAAAAAAEAEAATTSASSEPAATKTAAEEPAAEEAPEVLF